MMRPMRSMRRMLTGLLVSALACRAVQDAIVPVEPLASPAGPGAAESNLTVAADGQVYLSWLERAQEECDVLLWDGGNNDLPFYVPDVHVVVADPLRAANDRPAQKLVGDGLLLA